MDEINRRLAGILAADVTGHSAKDGCGSGLLGSTTIGKHKE